MPSECSGRLGERLRLTGYAAVLVAVGAWSCFHELERGMLLNDEAWFAYSTEHMLRTGDYVVPSIGNKRPHLNAAPLYNWLCCLTADLLGDTNVRHRAWGAASGVGCALAALALGALLFNAEAGLLAGLLILTNYRFLFIHGIREARMDAPLAFLVTCAVICAVKAERAAGRGLGWWAGVGLFVGLAAIMKPPVMAGFFFVAICGYHLLTRRDISLRTRVAGPGMAAVVAVVVSLPWYAAITSRLGTAGLFELTLTSSVGRAVNTYGGREQEPWWYYLDWIWNSSTGFKLVAAGAAVGCMSVLVGVRRSSWGILLAVAGSFLLAISASATRHLQYVYPIFPMLAVLAGGVVFGLGMQSRLRIPLRLVGVLAAAFVLRVDVRAVQREWRAERWEHPLFLVYKHAEPELAAGRVRMVLYRYPVPGEPLTNPERRFYPSERIYVLRVPLAPVVRSVEELNQLLADGVPTVVFLHHQKTPAMLAAEGLRHAPDAYVSLPSANRVPYPFLSFHGAAGVLRLNEKLGDLASPLTLTLPSRNPNPPAAPPPPGKS